jgi:type II secretory ATPase GspE/PulE/Tfp pilus assembly ATPase PilB-like protein
MPADPPVEKFIRSLLAQAFDDQATELVLGGDADAARKALPIRYKVGGVWYDMATFPQEIRQRVLDQLWQMAGLSAEVGYPKQAVFEAGLAGRQVEWRLEMKSVDSPMVLTPLAGHPPSHTGS